MNRLLYVILLTTVIIQFGVAQVPEKWKKIVGSAYLENHSYNVLKRICDEAGGRLVGSPQNEKAMFILMEELKKIGIDARQEKFTIPGWVRGNDLVKLTVPSERTIKAFALGYTEKKPAFEADVVDGNLGYASDLIKEKVDGKIVLIHTKRNARPAPPLRYQIIKMAADSGAKAVLFMNSQPGTLVRAGTGNFQGDPTAIPAYTIPYEEGSRILRLLKEGKSARMLVDTRSFCKKVETANVVVTFPGKKKSKIVLGAHFDSWDLGQGAIDNGIGSAILFDIARLIHLFSPKNEYTIELVWFNGEELGLWGSKKYVEMHSDEDIALMINMDMTGLAYGFDIMGFVEAKPYFEKLAKKLSGMDFSENVAEYPWTNSDHMPFMFKGIPCLTFQAKLDPDQSKYYHSMGDTFDKVKKNYLSHSAGAITIVTLQLANEKQFPFRKYTLLEVKRMMEKFGIDKRLKKQGEWIFDEIK